MKLFNTRFPLLKLRSIIGAKFGNVDSLLTLGAIYEADQPDQSGIEAANSLYQRAAKMGSAEAMWRLGVNHSGTKGKPPNLPVALEWMEKAVDAGHVMAAWGFGKLLLSGKVVGEDRTRGLDLLIQAAEAGYKTAQEDLVRIYRDGRHGLPANPEQSRYWMERLAAESGVELPPTV